MSSPRFLVIRGGAIGDFILTVPVISAIRECWPQAHIEVLGYPHIAELSRSPELVNEVRSISVRGIASFFAEGAELDREFRDYFREFQQVISFLYDPDHVFEENVKRAGTRRYLSGLHKPVEAEPPASTIHASRQLVKVLEALTLFVEQPQPKLYPQRPERMFAHEFYRGEAARPLVAVHPGSGGEAKVWSIANWAALCRWLIEDKKAHILLVGGEADQANVQQLRTQLAPHHVQLANNLKLTQLAAVLEQATLFAGHDSGISHLAAAVGVPSVVLFGPTNPAVWRPLGTKIRILQGPIEWKADAIDSFSQLPMAAITIQSVQKIIEEMLTS